MESSDAPASTGPEFSSYWIETTPTEAFPRLPAGLKVDVAVIGAGIAGICTAWELARAGCSVALIDADRIANSTTGNTTAKLTAQHSLIYAHLASTFGAESAQLYAAAQMDAIERVTRTVAELGIHCDLESTPAFTYTGSEEGLEEIHAEVEAALAAGLPATFVTDTGLPFDIAGAIRVEQQAQFHPRKYLLALVADFLAHGGRVFEQSRVVALDEGTPCVLTVADGATIEATDVVVATHYPIFDRALLFPKLVPHRDWVVAGPIPTSADPGGMYLTTEDNIRSVRTAPLNDRQRLLIVTGGSSAPGAVGAEARLSDLTEWAQKRFAIERFTHRWAAQDNTSADRIPYVGRQTAGRSHTYVAAGFGGWGMTNGVMAGRLLAAQITAAADPAWSMLFNPQRLHVASQAGTVIKSGANAVRHLIADRLTAKSATDIDALTPGSATVVRRGLEWCAIYRDDGGETHAVSASCTHLGCLVAFNDAETAWECPCHGSRFSVDGAVLHGPATEPLKPVVVDAPRVSS